MANGSPYPVTVAAEDAAAGKRGKRKSGSAGNSREIKHEKIPNNHFPALPQIPHTPMYPAQSNS